MSSSTPSQGPSLPSIAQAVRRTIEQHHYKVGTYALVCSCGTICEDATALAHHQGAELEAALDLPGLDIDAPIGGTP